MSEPKPVPLGPWSRGVNNVDDLQAPVFQPPTKPGDPPAQLRLAENVDLDRFGYPRRRQGRTKRLTLTDGRALAAFGDTLLLVDGDTLFRVEPNGWSKTTLATGLPTEQPVIWAGHGGSIWWACGEARGSLRNGAPFVWGLPTPTILSATPTAGGLAPGRYLVTATIERDGLESGAQQPVLVDLPDGGGIALNLTHATADAISLYCTDPDGKVPYFAASHDPGDAYTLDSLPTTDPCEFIGCHPPPVGQALVGYGGRLLIAADNILYWSLPLAYHHWRTGLDLQSFPGRITLLAPLDGGFYVGTEREVVFLPGDDPENWSPRTVDTRPALEGASIQIDGRKLPEINYPGTVQVWATTDGLAAGLPDGTVRHLTDGRLAVDPHQAATLAYREERGLRQILMSLRDRQAVSSFGASDAATCRIVRAKSV